MSGVNGSIEAALKAHLEAFAEMHDVPESRIVWPNESIDPNAEGDPLAGTFWLRATFMPGRPTTVSMGEGGMNRQVGVYQISCLFPKYEGSAEARSMADAIASHFLRGMALVKDGITVNITESGSASAGFSTVSEEQAFGAWYHIPVRIGYTATTLNA